MTIIGITNFKKLMDKLLELTLFIISWVNYLSPKKLMFSPGKENQISIKEELALDIIDTGIFNGYKITLSNS